MNLRLPLLVLAGVLLLEPVQAQTTTRVSVATGGAQGNNDSSGASISADGRFVAFSSAARNLVPGDTNGFEDVFVHNRQTGSTTRVSVASDGTQGNSGSGGASISADGRFVAFYSYASNLVPGDTSYPDYADVFVHDGQTGSTTRVSVASDGAQQNGDSRGRTSISADGRFVAFHSFSSNLVPGDTNRFEDVFVHDRQTGSTTRVSVASGGAQGSSASLSPSISPDGRFVAFNSFASDLVPGDTIEGYDVFVHDRQSGSTTRVSEATGGVLGFNESLSASISVDGRFVAFDSYASNQVPGDTNGTYDVFVHDRQTGSTTRVSVASGGGQGNGYSQYPKVSADGRFVAFNSTADNLVPGDTNGTDDVFVHDRQSGSTMRVNIAHTGAQALVRSFIGSISADGRFVAFASTADNLVPGDTNGFVDVFVHDRPVFASGFE